MSIIEPTEQNLQQNFAHIADQDWISQVIFSVRDEAANAGSFLRKIKHNKWEVKNPMQ